METGTEQRTPRNTGKNLKNDTREEEIQVVVVLRGGVPSFQTQRWEETLLSPRRVSEKRKKKGKKGKRFPESRGAAAAAAVDGYHMLQVKVEKLLPDP